MPRCPPARSAHQLPYRPSLSWWFPGQCQLLLPWLLPSFYLLSKPLTSKRASSSHLAHRRGGTCNDDLSRTNDTFSQDISRLGHLQDRSFRHICSRLRRDGLMPARIERLSGCANLLHAQLVEHRRESS